MSKQSKNSKLSKNPLENINDLDWITDPAPTEQKIKRIKNTSEKGLPEGFTRATFIVRKDLLYKLKNYAYTERMEIKQVVNELFESFLEHKEVIEKYNEFTD